ncbi:lipoyl synthase [Buchnera aphidicola]|uniref:Lipoyl synthase n=1 Tax=Buchnera aphidicola subsp. Tuberolachnus salignus TaxID=98804 RepID=A0A160SVY6_BUCTT|nr:lipoyl synthase [Buchnera aphidicola]CUR53157.1 Lipoyl synthase [Buchnera aphidicola (Tuberolachnus salignus)]
MSKILYKKKILLKKPEWLKINFPINCDNIQNIKKILRKNQLNTVCEEAQCPNLSECFNSGTATFMILGSVCTRKCPFCAVSKGRAEKVNFKEPKKLAYVISKLHLKHVVITSVTRDDLKDKGIKHFCQCIKEIRKKNNVTIEILVPDFRGVLKTVLDCFKKNLPNIFNHNIENVPRLYSEVRPGAHYKSSLKLLYNFHKKFPHIHTKSGLMLGLGERFDEVILVLKDLRKVGVSMITIGQYLQPSINHLPVKKYITPSKFKNLEKIALSMGFSSVFSGVFVRSSYHAQLQKQDMNLII